MVKKEKDACDVMLLFANSCLPDFIHESFSSASKDEEILKLKRSKIC